MNIEQEIKRTVQDTGSHYVHLIDGYELNSIMPKLARQYDNFTVNYIPEGGSFDIDEPAGKRHETVRVQMMWCGVVPFDKDATKEADSVADIIERKKAVVNSFIDALNASGKFETVTHYDYQIIPLRFDAVCACLIITFGLKANGECRELNYPEPPTPTQETNPETEETENQETE